MFPPLFDFDDESVQEILQYALGIFLESLIQMVPRPMMELALLVASTSSKLESTIDIPFTARRREFLKRNHFLIHIISTNSYADISSILWRLILRYKLQRSVDQVSRSIDLISNKTQHEDWICISNEDHPTRNVYLEPKYIHENP